MVPRYLAQKPFHDLDIVFASEWVGRPITCYDAAKSEFSCCAHAPSLRAMSIIVWMEAFLVWRKALRTIVFPSLSGSYTWELRRESFHFGQAFHESSSNDRGLTWVDSQHYQCLLSLMCHSGGYGPVGRDYHLDTPSKPLLDSTLKISATAKAAHEKDKLDSLCSLLYLISDEIENPANDRLENLLDLVA